MVKRFVRLYKRVFWSYEKYARSIGVKIGKNCNIQTRSFGTEPYLVEIGDHVQITKKVSLFTHGGGWVLRDTMPNFDSFGKIFIGNNVYIGNYSMIMPGVIIEDNVIVGAGSVVTKSIPSGSIVAGNSARIVGDLLEFRQRMKKYDFGTKNSKNKKNDILNSRESLFIVKPFLLKIESKERNNK